MKIKERQNTGSNADLEEKLSGFSGARSTVSQRYVVTGVRLRVPSPALKWSPSQDQHNLAPFKQYI